MESDATWWLESPDGLEVGGSGFSATLRDYGRFGVFLAGDGQAGGEPILPDGWVKEAGEGAFEAVGIFGQHIYVNPREQVVVVVWGALPKPTGKEIMEASDFFVAVCRALR
jgi:CubicO group peptidase (beta-lactamase class C family)